MKGGKPVLARMALCLFFACLAACQPLQKTTSFKTRPAQAAAAVVTRTPVMVFHRQPATIQPLPGSAQIDVTSTPAPTQSPNINKMQLAGYQPTQSSPVPTAAWITVSNGEADVPILVYHHVTGRMAGTRYSVTLSSFRDQMDALQQRGFHTIPLFMLADVLRNGGVLPPKPIIITFDDGNLDIYTNAFPIMKDRGFTGVLFIVSEVLNEKGYLNQEQIREMAGEGWEIGSHSRTHVNLTGNKVDLRREMYQSRLDLESMLHLPIKTFSYPFIGVNPGILLKAKQYGYVTAVCSGRDNQQRLRNIFCLSRREVTGQSSLEDFLKLVDAQ